MCDYSLMEYSNRLANEGEVLVVHRFRSGCLGLASPADAQPAIQKKGFWNSVKEIFCLTEVRSVTAVCIPPGARLILHDVPAELQKQYAIGPDEEVKFLELSATENQYRDAVHFRNGHTLRLQQLTTGQRVQVIDLGGAADQEPESSERLGSVLR